MSQSDILPARVAFRARLILALSKGFSYRDIARYFKTQPATISLWKFRFLQDGVHGLIGDPRRRPKLDLVESLIGQTERHDAAPVTCRQLAMAAGVSRSTAHRVLARAQAQSSNLSRLLIPPIPPRDELADLAGLFLRPNQQFAVFFLWNRRSHSGDRSRLAERSGQGILKAIEALESGRQAGGPTWPAAAEQDADLYLGFLSRVLRKSTRSKSAVILARDLSMRRNQELQAFASAYVRVGLYFFPSVQTWLDTLDCWSASALNGPAGMPPARLRPVLRAYLDRKRSLSFVCDTFQYRPGYSRVAK